VPAEALSETVVFELLNPKRAEATGGAPASPKAHSDLQLEGAALVAAERKPERVISPPVSALQA